MNKGSSMFLGLGLGLAAGTAFGLTLSPNKRAIKHKANKVIKKAQGVVDTITESL